MSESEWAITASRRFDVSPQRVWRAFRDRDEFEAWYCLQSDDFEIDFDSYDLSIGGTIDFTASFEDWMTHRVVWRITDLVEGERIGYVNELWLDDETGAMPTEPRKSQVEITLQAVPTGTEVIWAETGSDMTAQPTPEDAEKIAAHHLDRLAEHIAADN